MVRVTLVEDRVRVLPLLVEVALVEVANVSILHSHAKENCRSTSKSLSEHE
jgi:hypothetical protein